MTFTCCFHDLQRILTSILTWASKQSYARLRLLTSHTAKPHRMIATSLFPFSCVVSLLAEAQPHYEANRKSRKDESVTKRTTIPMVVSWLLFWRKLAPMMWEQPHRICQLYEKGHAPIILAPAGIWQSHENLREKSLNWWLTAIMTNSWLLFPTKFLMCYKAIANKCIIYKENCN